MRRYDCQPHELEPGEYCKSRVGIGDQGFDAWWFCTPNGLIGRLSMPEDVEAGEVAACHHVEEHDDGEISVLPQPDNSNSILTTDGRGSSWHGYIDHGEWRE